MAWEFDDPEIQRLLADLKRSIDNGLGRRNNSPPLASMSSEESVTCRRDQPRPTGPNRKPAAETGTTLKEAV